MKADRLGLQWCVPAKERPNGCKSAASEVNFQNQFCRKSHRMKLPMAFASAWLFGGGRGKKRSLGDAGLLDRGENEE
ncbi:MAG: hypothetical protein DBX60_07630 [Bacillota bacterium]|nr:MAG: hypothetical protein DBX60_07630 [Bacillota bacterium]